jgi:hypothetical protein
MSHLHGHRSVSSDGSQYQLGSERHLPERQHGDISPSDLLPATPEPAPVRPDENGNELCTQAQHTLSDLVDAKRKHAYQILQGTVGLSLADCQFYEDSVYRWIMDRRTFTVYELSRAVNGELIHTGKVWLQHALTRDAVHVLVSIYTESAGYKSQLTNLGGGRVPRLYYPDEAGRREWMSVHLPITSAAARDKFAELETLQQSPRSPSESRGKPGRKTTTADIAAFANECRPKMTWKEICSVWKREHCDDKRVEYMTSGKVREAWRRHFGDKYLLEAASKKSRAK